MNKTPLAINFSRFQAYRLAPDEVALFEFLLFKQSYYGIGMYFYYSKNKIEEELKIGRRRLKAIIEMFEEIGILYSVVEQEGTTNNKTTYFKIDFDRLDEDRFLLNILDCKSDFYVEFKKWVKSVK